MSLSTTLSLMASSTFVSTLVVLTVLSYPIYYIPTGTYYGFFAAGVLGVLYGSYSLLFVRIPNILLCNVL